MNAIKYALKAGRNMQARDDYMEKARASLVTADRRYYVNLARMRNSIVVSWLRIARECVP